MYGSLDSGSVVRRTFDIYVHEWRVLLPTASVVFACTGILTTILIGIAPGLVLITQLIVLVVTSLFTGMVVELVADVQNGQAANIGELLRAVAPLVGRLVAVGFVAAILQAIGFVLLVVPGLVLITMWSVFAPVIVRERPTGLKALRRSRELVEGNGWQVFKVVLTMFVVVGVIGTGLTLAANTAGTGPGLAVRVIVGIFGAPLVALAEAILYFDLLDIHARAGAEHPGLSGPFQPGPLPPAPS